MKLASWMVTEPARVKTAIGSPAGRLFTSCLHLLEEDRLVHVPDRCRVEEQSIYLCRGMPQVVVAEAAWRSRGFRQLRCLLSVFLERS